MKTILNFKTSNYHSTHDSVVSSCKDAFSLLSSVILFMFLFKITSQKLKIKICKNINNT